MGACYVHFDVYPAHMLPALARWKPEDILAAREIRQVMPEALDCFAQPRAPRMLPRPTQEFAHLYMWIGCRWVSVVPQKDADWPGHDSPVCNHKALILLVITYQKHPARAIVITRKRCNSPKETKP